MKGECRVQVNVSIRYLSFARKSFFIGLLLLNIMTRRACREIKETCLPLLFFVMCAIYQFLDCDTVPLLFGENGFPMGSRGIL